MKRTMFLGSAFLLAGMASAASPVVQPESVTLRQDHTSKEVRVSYVLDEAPGIVTVDFLTNGVSIGEANFANVSGDVNRLVGTGNRVVLWKPYEDVWGQITTSNKVMTARVKAWSPYRPPDYLVMGLETQNDVRYFVSTNALPGGLASADYRTKYVVMRKIPAAGTTFRMGSPNVPTVEVGSSSYRSRETPHLVTFTNDFFMAVFQTTQGQYAKITTNPSSFKNYEYSPFRPAENMTYNSLRGDGWPENGHAVAEGSFLALVRNRTGLEVDLPTDAQWEFACRAGSTQALNNDKNLTSETTCANLDEVAWYNGNSGGTTHPVGLKKPNAWGLYDMHGNVWDWCLDWMGVSYGPAMSDKPVVEPVGYTTAERPTQNGKLEIQRCRRGATYSHDAKICRSAWRGSDLPTAAYANTGFRMICPVGGTW